MSQNVTKVWLSSHSSAVTQGRGLMDRGFICGDVTDAAVLLAEMSSDLIRNGGGKQSGLAVESQGRRRRWRFQSGDLGTSYDRL